MLKLGFKSWCKHLRSGHDLCAWLDFCALVHVDIRWLRSFYHSRCGQPLRRIYRKLPDNALRHIFG